MGNIIVACVKFEAKLVGVADLDPNYAKRCDRCGTRQYTSSDTCRFCGGRCVITGLETGASIPAQMYALDPETGEMAPYWVDAEGALIPAERKRFAKEVPKPVPMAEAIDMDAIVKAVTEAADAVDPERNATGDILSGACVPVSDSQRKHEGTIVPKSVSVALDAVQCPVCLEEYDDPVTLPCGHSLCARHGTVVGGKCPICRAYFRSSHVKAWKNEKLARYSNAAQALISLTIDDSDAGD